METGDYPGRSEYDVERIHAYLLLGTPEWVHFGGLFESTASSLFYSPEVSSTNAIVKERIKSGEPGPHFLVADGQTAGKGTGGRIWVDVPGKDILFTVSGDVAAFPRRALLPLALGARIAANVEKLSGLRIGLKWPNDVVIGGKKAGGILAEVVRGDTAVIGVGINARSLASEYPTELRANVTTLSDEFQGGAPPRSLTYNGALDRLPFLIAAAGAVAEVLAITEEKKLEEFLEEYRRRDATAGVTRKIRLYSGETVDARYTGVDYSTGELVVTLPDGSLARINSASDVLPL